MVGMCVCVGVCVRCGGGGRAEAPVVHCTSSGALVIEKLHAAYFPAPVGVQLMIDGALPSLPRRHCQQRSLCSILAFSAPSRRPRDSHFRRRFCP